MSSKKVLGQDLAPDPLKRAFFSIEITSFLGPEILQFLNTYLVLAEKDLKFESEPLISLMLGLLTRNGLKALNP